MISAKTRKQRKARNEAVLHEKAKFLHVHLSSELKKKYSRRSVRVRKGDSVKILRGSYRGTEGKVDRVFTKQSKVHISGVERTKADGTKVAIPLQPSNLQLVQVGQTDKKRRLAKESKNG